MPVRPTILVVDDQPELLDGLSVTLELEGFVVLTATDGDEALARLHAHPVDLVLADIAMPRLNGYQLYEQIRANPVWLSLPVIFLTARAMESDVRYGKALGVDDYLTKPIKPDDLLAAVQGKLRRARQLAGHAGGVSVAGVAPVAQEPPFRLLPGRALRRPEGQQVRLSVREAQLLDYLMHHAERPVPPRELAQLTHGLVLDDIEAGSLIRPLVRSLRRKLGCPPGEEGCVANVRGLGYQFTPAALLHGLLR